MSRVLSFLTCYLFRGRMSRLYFLTAKSLLQDAYTAPEWINTRCLFRPISLSKGRSNPASIRLDKLTYFFVTSPSPDRLRPRHNLPILGNRVSYGQATGRSRITSQKGVRFGLHTNLQSDCYNFPFLCLPNFVQTWKRFVSEVADFIAILRSGGGGEGPGGTPERNAPSACTSVAFRVVSTGNCFCLPPQSTVTANFTARSIVAGIWYLFYNTSVHPLH